MGCYGDTHWSGGEEVFYYGFKDTHITERWHESYFSSRTPYHSSYDWLMPVCKKIIELYKIKSHKLELSMLIGSLNIALMNLEIEKVYECAINCIKWYNENK